MATESYVQIAPDGAGKQIDAFTVGTSPTVYRQAVVVADPTTQGNVATVTAAGALQVSDVVIGGAVSGTGGGTTTLSTTDSNVALAGSNDAPIFTAITGDPSGDFAGINLFEAAMDSGNSLGFNVRVQNQPTQDQNGALILSDGPIIAQSIAMTNGSAIIIPVTGYKSLAVSTSSTFTCTIGLGNDGNTFQTGVATSVGNFAWVSALVASGHYLIPCNAVYVRIVCTASGVITVTKRNVDIPANYGQAYGGVNGVGAIGGNVANGIAPTANPVLTAGWDGTLTRTIRTDTLGKPIISGDAAVAATPTANPVQVSGVDGSNLVRRFGVLPNQIGNINSAQVQDITATEGQTQIEILLQILTELKILNYYAQNLGSSKTDDPTVLRADPSFITQ